MIHVLFLAIANVYIRMSGVTIRPGDIRETGVKLVISSVLSSGPGAEFEEQFPCPRGAVAWHYTDDRSLGTGGLCGTDLKALATMSVYRPRPGPSTNPIHR